jgi:hypothetical protein
MSFSHRFFSLGIGLCAAAACPCAATAQEPAPGAPKLVTIARADTAPVIDGVLDEPVWATATLIEDLHQLNPVEYAPPSQRTEIRLFYDDNALYVSARLWDDDAEHITAQVLRQGEGLGSEDRFAVIIDPYLDRRSGYRFQVNPNGVRWDGLYQNTTQLESNWEGIWQGEATRDADGWTAEIAIPFKTLSFNPNTDQWGINFERTIERNGETLGWVSRNRQLNPGVAGTVQGFTGLQQGRGLDVVPSVSVTEKKTYGEITSTDSSLEPSLDVFYKLTPSLNAALTLNTDFSATEVDDRQVNLTRFSLFFPEKRDFFLQDADIFEFGRIGGGGRGRGGGGNGGGNNNTAVPQASAQNGRPFFSRRLGLSSTGEPVDINYGAKLSGRAGRWNIGALGIHQDQFDTVAAGDIFVGRITANVLDESSVGVIMTDGDPQSNLDSSLLGADFRYRNSRLPGGRLVEGQAWYQQSDNEGLNGDDRAFGMGVSSPNNTGWRGALNLRQFEDNFDPAVGFVNQTGIRDAALDFGYRYRFRDSYLRSVSGSFEGYRVERLDTGDLDTEIKSLRFNLENQTQDGLFVRYQDIQEDLIEDFEIYTSPDGSESVVVPAGRYAYNEKRIGGRSGSQRKFSVFASAGTGDFYGGTRDSFNTDITWRPSEHFSLDLGYRVDSIDLPEGSFDVRISSIQTQVVFSSTLAWVTLMQYDNVSEIMGINTRLHWIPEAGREGFIVINHNLEDIDRDGSFRSLASDATIKFSYTWRF